MLITERTVHKDSNNPNNPPTKTPINIPLILLASGGDLCTLWDNLSQEKIYYHKFITTTRDSENKKASKYFSKETLYSIILLLY